MQLKAYNDFIANRRADIDFAAFIDVDEFICLNKDKDISTFLEDYKNEFAVGLNWRVFGDSGLEFDGNWSVLKRFVFREKGFNKHIKTILNMNQCQARYKFNNPHFATGCPMVDVDKTMRFSSPFNPKCSTDRAWINHYHVKTKEEWKQKMARGRADTIAVNYTLANFDDMNINEVKDLTLSERYNNE